jgi:hypothetical protein
MSYLHFVAISLGNVETRPLGLLLGFASELCYNTVKSLRCAPHTFIHLKTATDTPLSAERVHLSIPQLQNYE